MLVERRIVQSFDETVALGTTHTGGTVFDVFKLKKQLERMSVWLSAIFTAVIGQYRLDTHTMLFKERQHAVVEHVHGGQRYFTGVKTPESIAAEAVDDRLHIHLANAFKGADTEGVDGYQLTGAVYFDLTFPELGIEALKQTNLFFAQFQCPLCLFALQA